MRDRFPFAVPMVAEVIAEAILLAILWLAIIPLIARAIVFLTGALHGLGFTQIPALSFWQSFGLLSMISLLAILLQAWRSNKKGSGR